MIFLENSIIETGNLAENTAKKWLIGRGFEIMHYNRLFISLINQLFNLERISNQKIDSADQKVSGFVEKLKNSENIVKNIEQSDDSNYQENWKLNVLNKLRSICIKLESHQADNSSISLESLENEFLKINNAIINRKKGNENVSTARDFLGSKMNGFLKCSEKYLNLRGIGNSVKYNEDLQKSFLLEKIIDLVGIKNNEYYLINIKTNDFFLSPIRQKALSIGNEYGFKSKIISVHSNGECKEK